MAKIRKVYLPKWMSWFGLVFLVPMWIWISYRALTTEGSGEELGFVGWAVVTFVMLGVAIVIFLMGMRRLPAYVIEEEEDVDGAGG